jgi:class 3 adenylate cyclase/CheY-like chemotaxis protein
MERAPRILVVDDTMQNARLLDAMLAPRGYAVVIASSGLEGLEKVRTAKPDLILLDIVMPDLSGYDVCRRLRDDPATRLLPVIMLTSSGDQEKVQSIEAGADDFIARPFNPMELLSRVRSLLRIKNYHDTIVAQTEALAELNRTLEDRVATQVAELARLGRLRRFFSPQVADLVLSDADRLLESHRREITVVFCDLRGFTAFSSTAEPEDVIGVLNQFYEAVGQLIFRHQGTLEQFAGDSVMTIFNDPVPCSDPALRAVQMAIEVRERMRDLNQGWRKMGHALDSGIGIAQGFATMGRVGFEGRFDYRAVGSVVNLAARLCAHALPEQILLAPRAYASVTEVIAVEPVGPLELKGFRDPVPAYNVLSLTEPTSAQPEP